MQLLRQRRRQVVSWRPLRTPPAAPADPAPLRGADLRLRRVRDPVLSSCRRRSCRNLEKAYAERTAAIEGGMQKAEEAQAQAQAALEQYQAQLTEARAEATRIREEAARAGCGDRRRDARPGPGRGRAASPSRRKKQIEAERQQAVVSLRAEVGRLSTDLASRIVGESLQDETRQRGIVDRFLAELEAGEIRPENAWAPAPAGASRGRLAAGRLMRARREVRSPRGSVPCVQRWQSGVGLVGPGRGPVRRSRRCSTATPRCAGP